MQQSYLNCLIFILKGVERLTLGYLMSACETVRRRSSETAVTFLYVPIPPPNEADYEKYFSILFQFLFSFLTKTTIYFIRYLDCLTTLTENWPPTLMVRGVSPVTSTTL